MSAKPVLENIAEAMLRVSLAIALDDQQPRAEATATWFNGDNGRFGLEVIAPQATLFVQALKKTAAQFDIPIPEHSEKRIADVRRWLQETDCPILEERKSPSKGKQGYHFAFVNLPSKEPNECIDLFRKKWLGYAEGYGQHPYAAVGAFSHRVQEIRQKVCEQIESGCGWVRVLDMTQPVALEEIFTEVNVLEEILGRRRLTIAELLKTSRVENFDLIGRDHIRQARISGLESVQRYSKLLIFGKPGSGKTTFLKRIATLCSQGKFQPHCVPLFITLKDFAEEPGKPTLLAYMAARLAECNVSEAEQTLKTLLQQGLGLVLLDALDEVRTVDISRVLKEIRGFSQQFHQCHSVITCRIASKAYVFEQFTEVEMADFSDEQIRAFTTNWFKSHNSPSKAGKFLQKLEDNKPIRELATNPLMLTLLCLVFSENANFPESRFELYEEGLDIWLKKWDDTRDIERDKIYRNLSYKRKKDLLSYIAFHTFKDNKYFIKQGEVERIIAEYIQHLPVVVTDLNELKPDSEVLLKAMELQHGLLVERARKIYSFSHLTFHEYLTARQIAHTQDVQHLKTLSQHVTEPLWRDVFLLTVSMLQNSDTLIQLMKQQIDDILTSDPQLKPFLTWVNNKSQSTHSSYNPSATRAYYFSSANVLPRASKLILNLDLPLAIDDRFVVALNDDPDIALDRSLVLLLDTVTWLLSAHRQGLDQTIIFDIVHDFEIVLAQDVIPIRSIDIHRVVSSASEKDANNPTGCALAVVIHRVLNKAANFDIGQILAPLADEALEECRDLKQTQQWLQQRGQRWIDELRQMMIQYRNIGYDWQFDSKQKELLQQYAEANKVLAECLSSDCYITRAVREEVTASLLTTSQTYSGTPA